MQWMWGQQVAIVFMLCLRYAFKSALPTWSFTRAALPEWTAASEWSFDAPECDKYTAVIGLAAAISMLALQRGVASASAHTHPAVSLPRWGLAAMAWAANMFLTFWLFSCHKYAHVGCG
jgi:hypothetical protein